MPAIDKAKRGGPEDRALQDALKMFHPDLDTYGVAVALEFASISEKAEAKGGRAVKVGGYPAIAKIRRTNDRERRYGAPDAIITFDRTEWAWRCDDERMAILDHELTHLELDKDANGVVKTDDNLRPKLAIRLHDVQFGWFREVADRHGDNSAEVRQATALFNESSNRQTFFQFCDASDSCDEQQVGEEASIIAM